MIYHYLLYMVLLFSSSLAQAIDIGSIIFELDSAQSFIAKQITNNNKTAKLYQFSIVAIDRPGDNEVITQPNDGELLFSPTQLVLQAGQKDYVKFYYNGPQDERERYYRIAFHEIPSQTKQHSLGAKATVNMEPTIVLEAIFIVRPRKVNFDWKWDKKAGTLTNSGNTYFYISLNKSCNGKSQEDDIFYLRPNDVLRHKELLKNGRKLIVYEKKYIYVDQSCQ